MFGTKNTSNDWSSKHFNRFLVESFDMFKRTFINLFINNKWQREETYSTNRTFFDCAGFIRSILHESNNKSDIQKVYFKKMAPYSHILLHWWFAFQKFVTRFGIALFHTGQEVTRVLDSSKWNVLRYWYTQNRQKDGLKDSLSILLEHGSLGIIYVSQKQNYSKFKLRLP